MNRRVFLRASAASSALLLAGSLGGCAAEKTVRNIRLAVEVDTPQGNKIGESVLQWAVYRRDSKFVLPQNRGTLQKISGEAVAVDMGESRVLFALLKGLEPALRLAGNYPQLLERKHYPMLVTFDDLDDPTSVKEVDPDDLPATFGEGYALSRIGTEQTQEPVTRGIEERLKWLGKLREMDLEVEDFPEGIPLGDFTGMFHKKTGI